MLHASADVTAPAGEPDRREGANEPATAGIPGSLDLHEGIATPGGCKRCSAALGLLSSEGELVPIRCRATNLCDYCARLMAVETSELLMLDAMEDAPSLYCVLTARELLTRADCRAHLTKLRRALKRRWPDVRWACLVEFQRRGALHLNLLVKGVPVVDRQELHERMSALWCARVDAEPAAQFVGEVTDGGGLVRYIALHFLKPAQAPPKGWRGHRWSYTRDYLVRPAKQLRQEARESLALKRELWRGRTLEEAQAARQRARETSWRLVHVLPSATRAESSAVRARCAELVAELEPVDGELLEARRVRAEAFAAYVDAKRGLP